MFSGSSIGLYLSSWNGELQNASKTLLRKIREKMNAITTRVDCNEIKKAVSQRPSAFGRFYIVHSFCKEAFALCGINGAGKTTSFAMLSGLLPKTNGRSMGESANKSFGYCAQTNGVEDFLAPVEHLDLFASVVPPTKTSSHASSSSSFSSSAWCERFHSLQKHKTVLAKNLSGGAKERTVRRNRTFVAEAAKQTQSHHPSLILLDEPTAGVDPFAKRKLWEAVEDVMKSNRGAAVVVTSHDVFECEKVCASVGLLREGKFLLCGNTSDIKKEFSKDACSLSSLEDVFIAVVEQEDASRSTD